MYTDIYMILSVYLYDMNEQLRETNNQGNNIQDN